MAKNTVSLGGGISDAGTSFLLSVSGADDIMSPWGPPATYFSGGYTSGTTASSNRAAIISNFKVRLGGSGSGYSGTADGNLQLSSNPAGTSDVGIYSQFNQTSTTASVNSGTIAYPINTSNTYYYGADLDSGTGTTFFFARGGGGNVYLNGSSVSSFAGDSLSGELTYQTIPSKPQSISAASILQTSFTLNWGTPADDGVQDPGGYSSTNIKGYRIAYKANASSTWLVWTANTGTSATSRSITGLSTNTKYDFQVSALNSVTDVYAATTPYTDISAVVGERSDILTVTTLSSAPKVWDSATSSFKTTTAYVWNGAAWVPADTKVWNGTAFVPLIL